MSRLVEIDINQIIANPYQPRTTFDKDSLTELSQSILENGLIQPIVVRESMNGKYEIVAGERRFKAANMAGYQKVPCIVQEYTDLQSAQIALIENIQRENLSPIEEAEAFQTLIAMTGMTQQELALKVGKRQSTIANKLRLLKLPESVKEALKEKKMTERHARAMLSVTDQRVIDEITKKVIENKLTVNETEKVVREEIKANKKTQKVMVLTQSVRIALNTIKQAVNMIQKSNIDIAMEEEDRDDIYVITLKVQKHK